MRLKLIAVGTRLPGWINQGYTEYAGRMPKQCSLELKEIPLAVRNRNTNPASSREDEGGRIVQAITGGHRVVALEVSGQNWSTEKLAAQLSSWMQDGRDVDLLVGGPDGLAPACLERADQRWSLSALTFPHALVRVIVAEQLYRAFTVIDGHPYHRA